MNGIDPPVSPPVFTTQQRVGVALATVYWSTLAALLFKLPAYMDMARAYFTLTLEQDFFPPFFRSPLVVVSAYVILCMSLVLAAVMRHHARRTIANLFAIVCSSVLCLHQGSHNDMTFVTAWWTVIWTQWFLSRIPVDEPSYVLKRSALLSRVIISMMLLGGAVGKWTGEYWSGQVLYEIYFVDRDYWIFNLLRRSLDADSLRNFATSYSRLVIVTETLCGFGLWMLPPRSAAIIAIVVLGSIIAFSNVYLCSVLLSLIGLASVGLFVSKPTNVVTPLD